MRRSDRTVSPSLSLLVVTVSPALSLVVVTVSPGLLLVVTVPWSLVGGDSVPCSLVGGGDSVPCSLVGGGDSVPCSLVGGGDSVPRSLSCTPEVHYLWDIPYLATKNKYHAFGAWW